MRLFSNNDVVALEVTAMGIFDVQMAETNRDVRVDYGMIGMVTRYQQIIYCYNNRQ